MNQLDILYQSYCNNKISNIYLVDYLTMSRQYATIIANNSIQTILNHGAQKMYDKYINQKLPYHTNQITDNSFKLNFKMSNVPNPNNQKVEKVSNKIINNIPKDTFAPKRINIKKFVDQFSTISPKKSNLLASTKYQTFVKSNNSFSQNAENNKLGDRMLIESSRQLKGKQDRPMTMQIGRSHKINQFQSQINQIPQKRAATCHVRKRKKISLINQQKKKLLKLQDNIPVYIQQQLNEIDKIRQLKTQRIDEEKHQDQLQNKKIIKIQRQDRKKRQYFQQLKQQIHGKSIQNPIICNFQSLNGQFTINNKIKPQLQPHIIQLQFNPEEQNIIFAMKSKQNKVNGTKKTTFMSNKVTKKLKMTQQQFTNNNQRQTSSIPFLSLSEGVTMQESTLQVKATRQRPDQLTRKKYNSIQVKDRFQSFNKHFNTARINLFETIQTNIISNVQKSQSIVKSPSQKLLYTTLQSKTTNNSILWRSNFKQSEKNKIKISNKELLKQQFIQISIQT